MTENRQLIADFLFRFLKPIYIFQHRKRINVGTGALVEVRGKKFLITAAHVLGKIDQAEIFVQDLHLSRGFWNAETQGFDFSVYQLFQEDLGALASCNFLPADFVEAQAFSDGQVCHLAGYPSSKNKNFDNSSSIIFPQIHIIQTRISRSRGNDENHYFYVDYNNDWFSPDGMSGGLIIGYKIDGITPLSVLGMPVEKKKSSSKVKCIKYKLIINSIRHGILPKI